ncbi:hypothetical protein LX32DRAFT_724168 [Colletotrichum zoysiae]|uniref:Uncharacterized protein n=1 Tax=Colletotrichum zoysiae TaxID=1216348 RepID=A0AAD9HTG9_9PEZI|nr:hypothetical protein LX32DRAFT_724168 [Colletotrichum zoysiae]
MYPLDDNTGGHSHHWPRNVFPRTAYFHSDRREGVSVVDDETPNDGRWDLQDFLIFKCLDHFWLPSDAGLSAAECLSVTAVITVNIGGRPGALKEDDEACDDCDF